MDDDGGNPAQPMDGVKEAAKLLCDSAQSADWIGLSVYSWNDPGLFNRETGKLEIGLTSDRNAVKGYIDTLTAGLYADYTNIAGGIRVGGETLRDTARPETDRVLVILTDGIANRVEPPHGVPVEDLPDGNPPGEPAGDAKDSARGWAQEVAGYNITIHTVSLGANADHDLMGEIAGYGNGNHYEITGSVSEYTQELLDVFKELGQGEGTRSTLVK